MLTLKVCVNSSMVIFSLIFISSSVSLGCWEEEPDPPLTDEGTYQYLNHEPLYVDFGSVTDETTNRFTSTTTTMGLSSSISDSFKETVVFMNNIMSDITMEQIEFTFSGGDDDVMINEDSHHLKQFIKVNLDRDEVYNDTYIKFESNRNTSVYGLNGIIKPYKHISNKNTMQAITRVASTSILGATVFKVPSQYEPKVELRFKLISVAQNISHLLKPYCAFWNDSLLEGFWSTNGLKVVESNISYVQCTSNHLTNFAAFFAYKDTQNNIAKSDIITKITLVGCSISVIFLIITIVFFGLKRSAWQDEISYLRNFIICNLSLALLLLNLATVLSEIESIKRSSCKNIAIVLHFALMSVFTWITTDSIYLMISLVYPLVARSTITKGKLMKISFIFGWLCPTVGIVIGDQLGHTYQQTNDFCWMKSEDILLHVVVPVAVMLTISMSMFGMILKSVIMPKRKATRKDRNNAKLAFILLLNFGVTWIFGFGVIGSENSPVRSMVFAVIFTILNSMQGLMIFVIHILRRSDVKESLSSCYRCSTRSGKGFETKRVCGSSGRTKSTTARDSKV